MATLKKKSPTTSKYSDTDAQAFKRIAQGLKDYRITTEQIALLAEEAKEREIWKLKYFSFKEFCEKECGYTKQWIYRLLNAVKQSREVNLVDSTSAKNKDFPVILTPKMAEVVVDLTPSKQRAVVEKAIELNNGERPTPKELEKAKAIVIKPKPKEMLDTMGCRIPARSQDNWNMAKMQANKVQTEISRLKCFFEQMRDSRDKFFIELDVFPIVHELEIIYNRLEILHPGIVCTHCQGQLAGPCPTCSNRGHFSKDYWDYVKDDAKNLREKVIAAYE